MENSSEISNSIIRLVCRHIFLSWNTFRFCFCSYCLKKYCPLCQKCAVTLSTVSSKYGIFVSSFFCVWFIGYLKYGMNCCTQILRKQKRPTDRSVSLLFSYSLGNDIVFVLATNMSLLIRYFSATIRTKVITVCVYYVIATTFFTF